MQEAAPDLPPLWRRLARHGLTLLLIGLICAIVAPTIATLLMALQANGPSPELAYAIMLAPWAILLAGPGVFLLGLVFGWMVLVLAAEGHNTMPIRIALAVLIASLAWWLAEPAPGSAATPGPEAGWLVWALSAAATAPLVTRGWVAHRLRHPIPLPQED
jgi:hypothetical protein